MLKIKGKSYYNPKTQYIDPKFAKAQSGFIHWEASKGSSIVSLFTSPISKETTKPKPDSLLLTYVCIGH